MFNVLEFQVFFADTQMWVRLCSNMSISHIGLRQMCSALSKEHSFGRVRFMSAEKSVLHVLHTVCCNSEEFDVTFCLHEVYVQSLLFLFFFPHQKKNISTVYFFFFSFFLMLDIVQSWIYGDQSLHGAVINPINCFWDVNQMNLVPVGARGLHSEAKFRWACFSIDYPCTWPLEIT